MPQPYRSNLRHTRGCLNIELYDEDDDKEFTVTVTYSYYHGCPGGRDKYGAPEEPDDDPELEILACLHEEDECECYDDLTTDQKKEIEEAIYKDME